MSLNWHLIDSHTDGTDGKQWHSMVSYDDSIYVFGGYNNITWLQSLWKFTPKIGWTEINCINKPPPRRGHTATRVNHSMYIYGGYGTHGYYNDIHAFDFISQIWKKINPENEPPRGRHDHSCVLYENKKLVIFGGDARNITNEVILFDTSSNQWSTLECKGDLPEPRRFHQSTMYKNRYMYIFGGGNVDTYYNDLKVLDMETLIWRSVEQSGNLPKPRYGHCMVHHENEWILFGGVHYVTLNDTFILSLENHVWKEIKPSFRPARRKFHKMTILGDKIYLFGGEDDSGNVMTKFCSMTLNSHQLQTKLLEKLKFDQCTDVIFV